VSDLDSLSDAAVVISAASRPLRRQLRPLVWVTLEEVALEAVTEGRRLVARTSARQVAERLGVDPGSAAGALRVLRRKGLLLLEREHGPSGRFGLSVYVLGPLAGLTVRPPRVAEPDVARPSLEQAGQVDADPGPPDTDGLQPGRPGTAEPCPVQPHVEEPRAIMHRPTKAATALLNATETAVMSPSLATPQCPGQTTLDLGSASA
jgi:DNA-binding transcriptional ArsR family regulator